MEERGHEPGERLCQDPRNWRRSWAGYTAHFAQGLLVRAGLGFATLPRLAWYYLSYQTTEYRRLRDVRGMYLRILGGVALPAGTVLAASADNTIRAGARDAGSRLPLLLPLAALLLVAASAQACGAGGGGRSELPGILELVPADVEAVWVFNLEQIARDPPRALGDEVADLSEYGIEDMGVLGVRADELTALVAAIGDEGHLLVVEGDLDFAHITDQLEAGGYDFDQYRGFELWEGHHEAVVLFEDRGRAVIGSAEAVKSVLRMLDRGSGSLLDDADSDLGRALRRAGAGWMSSAQEQCLDFEIRGCRAVGVSFRRGDDDHLVETTIAALFRNERTAESEMDELEDQLEEDSSFEFDIGDVQLDGDFVIVTASADEDALSEGESPVPVSFTGAVTGDAPDTRDDHGDSAYEYTPAIVGEPVVGVVNHRGDVDYFAFAAFRGQTYEIDVALGTMGDSVVTLHAPNGQELEFDDDGGNFGGSRITWTAAVTRVYYVAVTGWGGDTGSYTLTVTAIDAARDDHGNSADEATFTTVGEPVIGVVNHRGDVDYFAFAAHQGQTYEIDVALGTLNYSYAAVYGPDGQQLEFDDGRGESSGSRIVWTAAASGTHYVKVAGWGSHTGSYTLTVTATGDTPDTRAPDTRDDHGDSADEATPATVGEPQRGSSIDEGDRSALVALYNSTDGTNWESNSGWLSDSPLEWWYGVATNSDGRVIVLDLTHNELTGTIPAELGDLANLRHLSLRGNELTGTIPAELGDLANLQYLSLGSNGLMGTIPAELGDLANLQYLDLGGNELTGTIPAELGDVTKLGRLNLGENQLTGTIPAELGDLANLEALGLSSNRLTGAIPAELGSLANLLFLSLGDNELTGTIPAQLGDLANLRHLNLRGNELTGIIPAELGDLTHLEWLLLGENQLTGTVPAELGDLANLTDLSLAGNRLTGCMPAGLRDVQSVLSDELPVCNE